MFTALESESKKFDSSTVHDEYFTIFTSAIYFHGTDIDTKFCEQPILAILDVPVNTPAVNTVIS